MDRWKSKWYPVGSKCTGLERTTSQTNISLAQAQGAFYILGIGLLIASLCLLTERLFKLRKWKILTAKKKLADNERVTYVGRMSKRVSKVNAETKTYHNPQFASPFETANGNLYTYTTESSTDTDIPNEDTGNAKRRKKSNSCPVLFGCCVKDNTEEYSTQNGIGVGAANLRSAFSDTLWTNKQKPQQNGALHSNGVMVQNGGRHVKSDKYPGFTFESFRDSQQSIHSTNKDAETGEISNDATFFSIRL